MKVFHFNNGTGGGVLSVIKNLIEHSRNPEIENHVVYTINKDKTPQFEIPVIRNTASVQVFYFSPKWNFWYTCKQLAKLIPDSSAVLVAHDWLELGMASHLGLQNPVVQFLHGDFPYYYNLSFSHNSIIDKFACVSPTIIKTLQERIPSRNQDIKLTYFPVPGRSVDIKKDRKQLNIIFVVRDLNEDRKQFELLPKINSILNKRNVAVNWNIIGSGKSESEIKSLLGEDALYTNHLRNNDVLEILSSQDIFLLPSLSEGLPVALVEAMKSGVVPLITDWNGATCELVQDNISGYYCEIKDVDEYAEKIMLLHNDRNLLKLFSANARESADRLFDPFKNTKKIEELFIQAMKERRVKKAKKVYGSRLDKKWMPNWVVKNLRT